MAPKVGILILGSALVCIASAAFTKMTCEEFSKGSTFSSSQAVATWYLLNIRPSNDPGDARCVQFSTIGDQERQSLQAKIGQYVKGMKWENLGLKMQIPCLGEHNNKTREYFLERQENDGSYLTLLMPPPHAKLDPASFNRHAMRLKLIEGKYLALMDCLEHFTFVLAKQPHEKELEPELVKILKPYLPEEF